MTIRSIPDVPPDEVEMVENDFKTEGCTVATKPQAGSTNVTVVGTCPDTNTG
jgi:hypothetical protein